MTADVATELLKQGVLGLMLIISGLAVWNLWNDNKAGLRDHLDSLEKIQALRVSDAQAVTAQLLASNAQCVTALTNVTNALEAQREAMTELKGALEKLGEEIRRRPGRP